MIIFTRDLDVSFRYQIAFTKLLRHQKILETSPKDIHFLKKYKIPLLCYVQAIDDRLTIVDQNNSASTASNRTTFRRGEVFAVLDEDTPGWLKGVRVPIEDLQDWNHQALELKQKQVYGEGRLNIFLIIFKNLLDNFLLFAKTLVRNIWRISRENCVIFRSNLIWITS